MTETERYDESDSAAVSVNGLRPQADDFILDGVDNNDGLVDTILFFPNIDATQNSRSTPVLAPARYSRAQRRYRRHLHQVRHQPSHGFAFSFYRDKARLSR